MLFTDPEATLSKIYDLAQAIEDIHPDLSVEVKNDEQEARSAVLSIQDKGQTDQVKTTFNIVGGRFISNLAITCDHDDEKIKVSSDSTKKDISNVAIQLIDKAGIDLS